MSNQNSENNYSLDRWLTILAVALAAAAIGNLVGLFRQRNRCDEQMDNVQEMCIMTSNDAFDFCRETMDRMENQCLNQNPTVQQDRIYKWEVCFADENCRNCLMQTMEGGSSGTGDVEWCHTNALQGGPLPEYDPPPEYEPPLRGPNI